MSKFLVLYLAPTSVLDDWKKTDPATRQAAEQKMESEWKEWMNRHANMLADIGAGVGRPKRVAIQGVADSRNDVMCYSIVEAQTHDGAARLFENHPHLQIPQSSIEVMELFPMGAS